MDGGTWLEGVVDNVKTPRLPLLEDGDGPRRGTSGAVDAPSSGGEELVRQHTQPRGGVCISNSGAFGGMSATDARFAP